MPDFAEELKDRQAQVEAFLEAQFRQETPYGVLLEAMRYSLLAGGKRLRPVLCLSFCEACGGEMSKALEAASAIEMVHTYSLIHDDLPCMDNDDYRRGRPTSHRVYGENIATLAGDGLLTAAFRYLAEMDAEPAQIVQCVALLAAAAGEHGMVAGQILDLEGEKRPLTERELRLVHSRKTGDLIRAACQMGVVLGGGGQELLEAAGTFAEALGMAFQIRDDMLDRISTQEELGKPIGSDESNGKSTFVSLLGLDACQRLVEQETERAIAALKGGFVRTDFLTNLARALTGRRK